MQLMTGWSTCILTCSTVCMSPQATAQTEFFRFVSPTSSQIETFDSGGTVTWSNGAVGVTGRFERATSLTLGIGDWATYAEIPVSSAVMSMLLFDPDPPSGMVLIPSGTFSMGDAVGDGTGDAPLHTVFLSGFYADQREVSKAEWDEVRTWGLTNGYADLPVGSWWIHDSSKGTNHPVQNVRWYDVVKWCNAKSEMEGRTPAYYTSTATTTVYRTGDIHISNSCVKWDTGYRLPTEAEWEKAARGGAAGRRFPWGDTIQHARANYWATSNYDYDTSPTTGWHPDYYDGYGNDPYTSPVGSFPPNAYALFDVSGNVSEWCWDRYSTTNYTSGLL